MLSERMMPLVRVPLPTTPTHRIERNQEVQTDQVKIAPVLFLRTDLAKSCAPESVFWPWLRWLYDFELMLALLQR